jgi:hypothetical protein
MAAELWRRLRPMAIEASPRTERPHSHAGSVAIEEAGWKTWLGREGFLVLLVCGYAALLLAFAQRLVSTDSWFALVGGRLIARHGIPSHNTLTLWAYGKTWVDQQWLAQLGIYELERAGGIRLAVAVHVLLVVGAFAAAVALARVRGASPKSVAVVAPLALLPLSLSSAQLRTQTFAYVLFVAVIALITRAESIGWRRLALLLGILALWANLHGSVVLAAGLVSLRGIVDVVGGLRSGRPLRRLGWLVAALPWPCLFLTPYFLGTSHYYAQTVLNPTLSRYLAQWQPSTFSIVSLPLFTLALGYLWLLGRGGSAYSRFEKLTGLLLVAFALLAVRNWVWLSLFAVAFYPKAIDSIRVATRAPIEATLNRVFGGVGISLATLASVLVFAHPQSWFTRDFPPPAARRVSTLAAARPGARVWATTQWADWLLWEDPGLEGRMAFDARVELLTAAEVKRLVVFSATTLLIPQVRRRYDILAVSRTNEPDTYRALRRQGPVVYDNGDLLVVSALKSSR